MRKTCLATILAFALAASPVHASPFDHKVFVDVAVAVLQLVGAGLAIEIINSNSMDPSCYQHCERSDGFDGFKRTIGDFSFAALGTSVVALVLDFCVTGTRELIKQGSTKEWQNTERWLYTLSGLPLLVVGGIQALNCNTISDLGGAYSKDLALGYSLSVQLVAGVTVILEMMNVLCFWSLGKLQLTSQELPLIDPL